MDILKACGKNCNWTPKTNALKIGKDEKAFIYA